MVFLKIFVSWGLMNQFNYADLDSNGVRISSQHIPEECRLQLKLFTINITLQRANEVQCDNTKLFTASWEACSVISGCSIICKIQAICNNTWMSICESCFRSSRFFSFTVVQAQKIITPTLAMSSLHQNRIWNHVERKAQFYLHWNSRRL